MNIFAGNFSLEEKTQTPELDFDIVQTGEKSYFIMGAEEGLDSSEQVASFIQRYFGKLSTHDISIEGEDALEIISSEYEVGAYECVSFEGPTVEFDDILERFAGSSEAIVIRETEESKIYGNKIIRVDFLY
ncbi:hypothetical protein LR010_02315 [Candidatus Gracilibacteria bacterium]|nr:hypothetical protein [Candidatus Gracilibacteria bacterium]